MHLTLPPPPRHSPPESHVAPSQSNLAQWKLKHRPIPDGAMTFTDLTGNRRRIFVRAFMVINAHGEGIGCKQAEPLAAVVTEWKDRVLTLKYPGQEDFSFDTKKDLKDKKFQGTTLPGIDCGDEVSSWLSKALYKNTKKARLVYKGDFVITRQAKRVPFHNFTQYKKTDRAAYSDWSSYHLACQSSLDDLNSRMEEPILMDNFRPNIIVKGSKPFDENDWAFVKIGDVVLRRLKPCQRCFLTTIDPIRERETKIWSL
ncbi:mitochondrial amidoxime reducing component 2-like [Macrobrachium rosenbergii]|uniref:mitochondrial amidoxime reducing component 2-like n=1 Tax=Macrobrachium rosenbergii TaxID=79674 RepID=UPI0034D55F99